MVAESGITEYPSKIDEALAHLWRAEDALNQNAPEQAATDLDRAAAVLRCLKDCGEGPCVSGWDEGLKELTE